MILTPEEIQLFNLYFQNPLTMAKTTVTGSIQDIKDVIARHSKDGTKTFYSRAFIVTEVDEEYPQSYELEVNGPTSCDAMAHFHVGQVVTCEVNLRGNIYQKEGVPRVFNKLVCWKISPVGGQYANVQAPQQQPQQYMPPPTQQNGGQQDDLPF